MSEDVIYKTWAVCDARQIGDHWPELCLDMVLTGPPYYDPSYMRADDWVEMLTVGLLSAGSLLKDEGVMAIVLNEYGHYGYPREVVYNLQKRGFGLFGEDIWVHGGNQGEDEYDHIFYLSRGRTKPKRREVAQYPAPNSARVRLNPMGSGPARTAMFGCLPKNLAFSLIDKFTKPGDLVLDPFCGTGTITHEAGDMGRVAYGSDVEWEIVEHARNRR
jgi:DNA modification methylase